MKEEIEYFCRPMKNMRVFTAAILFTALLSAYKQDFDVTSGYKQIPVVYGLLNQQETTHYIRVQKGYLIDGDARVAAGVFDSIYYPNTLTVKLIPYLNGSVSGSHIVLTRVNGNDIGLPKQNGLFANDSNILYTFNGNLDQNKQYELLITNADNDTICKTKLNSNNTRGIRLVKDFTISLPNKGGNFNLNNSTPGKIFWNDAENGNIYDLTIRFHYKEFLISNGTLYRDTFIDIPAFRSVIIENGTNLVNDYQISSDQFLQYLAANLKSDAEVNREFNIQKAMQFKFAVGGTELSNFLASQQAQGGIASNEALPIYTNLDNGAGLLSSRYYKQVDSVLLSSAGIDSLIHSGITSGLKFRRP